MRDMSKALSKRLVSMTDEKRDDEYDLFGS